MKYKHTIILLLGCLFFSNTSLCQVGLLNKSEATRIYEEAEKLYRAGNYSLVLEFLKRESGSNINLNDSLIYLRIMSLQHLYKSNFDQTSELESSLKLFLSKVNRYSFPEQKYSDISSVYTVFQTFKEKDRRFYDSVSKTIDLNKPASLPAIRSTISDYQKANVNSYYAKEFNEYTRSIDNKLTELENKRKKHVKDSLNRQTLKAVGKLLVMTVSYASPTGVEGRMPLLQNYNDVIKFYNGTSQGILEERYVLNASLAEALINIYTGTRAKLSLDWNLFDIEYAVFDWKPNNYIMDKESSGVAIKEFKSIKLGTRIGPQVTFLLTPKIAGAVYYSARPGIQFLLRENYFTETIGANSKTYGIKPVRKNYNLTNEVGAKLYFFKRIFVNPYLHIGNYKWENEIYDVLNISTNKTQTRTNYQFKHLGLRIGF